MSVLVINGPNLNTLGTREPGIYGHTTLPQIESSLVKQGREAGVEVQTFQSNHEGAIVDRIQEAQSAGVQYIVINAGAFTHTSVAIRDALVGSAIPFIELHISNVHAREEFRHHSYLSDVAVAVIAGLGADGYRYALDYAISHVNPPKSDAPYPHVVFDLNQRQGE
ncbi:MAG: type II 3-dehydroquinate dehydratase [Propionibacteriaceae bacterium]|jgi:3-dehydroquinate dehydratase-2|nr:type II 3-dehydroquinate dehydratase [Propionibacteriaceae bacterium]